ncbi:MAG TPA: hypothetical protein VJ370_20260 [Streptosporangiaceae bacterium]|nr:hypothetical protein [Streptosporangiaceae bacterium]
MNQWRTCACVLGALLLTGCTAAGAAKYAASQGTSQPPARATGHLTGKLSIEGGPIGPGGKQPGERPIPGTVTLTAAGHRPVTIKVGNSGRFSAWLPSGRYRVVWRSPAIITVTDSGHEEQTSSPAPPVTISARHVATITLVAIVP